MELDVQVEINRNYGTEQRPSKAKTEIRAPVIDAHVAASKPNNAYDSNSALQFDTSGRITYFKFDLSGIRDCLDAVLHLYSWWGARGNNVTLALVDEFFAGVTYNTRPEIVKELLTGLVVHSTSDNNAFYETVINITDFIKEFKEENPGERYFCIALYKGDGDTYCTEITSSECEDVTKRPHIDFIYK